MKLVAIRCPECGQPLAPDNDHLVIACAQCGAAARIDDEGVRAMPMHYAAPMRDMANPQWMPFWIFSGRVNIVRRETQGGNRRMGDESARFWAEPRRLYVPAWELSIDAVRSAGVDMLKAQPAYESIPRPIGARLTPAVVSAGDARKMLEFIVLSLEAGRDDWLTHLDFRLEVGEPEMWALPYDEKTRR